MTDKNCFEEQMMKFEQAGCPASYRRRQWKRTLGAGVAMVSLAAALPAGAETLAISHNTPRYVSTAKMIGPANPSAMMEVNLWLKPHNRDAMDALAKQLYDRTSPLYRQFLTPAAIAARFAPTADEAATVSRFLESRNLQIVRVGPSNFFVRARGTVAAVEATFGVKLNNYQVLGKTVRANDRDPVIEGAAGALVGAVAGLDSGTYDHPAMAQTALLRSGTTGQSKTAAGVASSDFFTSACFGPSETEVFSTNSDGSLPVATYKGAALQIQSLTSAGCGYTPPPIYQAYHLSSLYKKGFNGAGQTIGIIDWCGSLTIQSDANAFSTRFKLPQLTSSNFAITYTPTPSLCEAADQVEINIDVEWAHAIAPGANINLIVPPSATFLDIDEATFTTVNYGLATVLSGSFGSAEEYTAQTYLETENLISEIAAMSGISINYSSGDAGDFTYEFIPPTVSAPADSPWATAVGGTTLALNADNSIAWQAGWGNNETLLAEAGFVPDPIAEGAFGFIGGSGGGPSTCATQSVDQYGDITCLAGYPKPAFQSKLPGKVRLLPDIAWLADPYTGVAILITVPGSVPEQVWQVWGGTSVAAPMFSGLWAIAQQEAGYSLGQAAQYVYTMPASTIFDIVPVASKTNVIDKLVDANGTTVTGPTGVMGGVASGGFISAIWNYPSIQQTALAISFGEDCAQVNDGFETLCGSSSSLHTKIGWDNVTGVGVPNGEAFANFFAPATTAVKAK
jgi:subtilase family serine protease